jgi:hypothetical protein
MRRFSRGYDMSVFFRYLISMLVHMMWARTGNRGPVPPLRVPRKGPLNLPAIGPWQMMIVMWTLRTFWEKYGRDLKLKLMSADHPIARRVGSLLPNTKKAAASGSGGAGSGTTAAPATVTVPAAPATASTPAAPPSSHFHTHSTQPLPTRRLPAGSILSSLRPSS